MQNSVRVGFAVPKLDHGGPEEWLLTLLRHLPETIEPRVVITAPGGACSTDMALKVRKHCDVWNWESQHNECLYYANECDVIVTWGQPYHDFRRAYMPAVAPARRVVFLAHGLAPMDGVRGKERYADHYAAVCDPAAMFFDGPNQCKVRVIENGVDLERVTPRLGRQRARERFECKQDALVVGWAGRLSPEKNYWLPVKVADPWLHKGAFRFLFAGSGAAQDVSKLTQTLQGYNVPGTRWVGHVPRIGDFLEALDALVISSYTEACPLVLLEAFAAGVPVITSKYPFIDQLEAEAGLLTRRINAEAPEFSLMNTLFQLQSDKRVTAARAARARKLAWRRFNASAFAQRWADYLLEIANT